MISKKLRKILFAMVMVILLGIVSRRVPLGCALWDNYLGDALYAVLGYLLLSACWMTGKPLYRAALSFSCVVAIETFQLTGIPLQLSFSSNLPLKVLAIVLGTTFGWGDIAAYFCGILGVYIVERCCFNT